MDDNSLTYPNAEILVPAKEHQFWMDDGEMSRAPKGRIEGNFKNVRRVFTPRGSKAREDLRVGQGTDSRASPRRVRPGTRPAIARS